MRTSDIKYRPRRRSANKGVRRIFSSGPLVPVLVIVALVLFACTLVWQRVYILNLSTEVGELKKEENQLIDLIKKNELEINDLCRRSRIEKFAGEQLGLQQTASENLFTLVSERKFTESNKFADMLSSLKKVAEHLPVVSESKAETKDIFEFDED